MFWGLNGGSGTCEVGDDRMRVRIPVTELMRELFGALGLVAYALDAAGWADLEWGVLAVVLVAEIHFFHCL